MLARALWKGGDFVGSNAVTAHVKNLRKKLLDYGPLVETVIGQGYRLNADWPPRRRA